MNITTQKIPNRTEARPGYATVNGINMYYEIYGEGNIPLILIHGGGSTIESTFHNLLPYLQDYGKIVAVELQAHGRTSDRNAPESFEQDADDVATLLRVLEIQKANILGFSNGGTTTLQIANRHPELVNKIIVISAGFKREGFVSGFFEGMPKATLLNMPEKLKQDYLKVNPNKEGLYTMFKKDKERMIHFQDIPERLLGNIKFPTLIVSGDRDVTTVEHAVLLNRLIKGSRLLIVPGTHGSFIGETCSVIEGSEAPQFTATMIKEFLRV